ncbi:RAD55 family ATPase [Methanolacinia paynteri]|uniref:RAD55 family ATPase n=1 Tax=Methanolacinia paynteri TaxID=230356 RepID=UPI00064F59A1|nr:ATPase domain-containing protein [Methanolacinia paynteri]
MNDNLNERMPTGISSLDPVLDGGVPPGSVVLLIGEQGAGNREFVQSSMIYLSKMKAAGQNGDNRILPEQMVYVSFTRLTSSIIDEIKISYKKDLVTAIEDNISFIDLSNFYFEKSVVPRGWYSRTSLLTEKEKGKVSDSLVAELTNSLRKIKNKSLIIIDSLTDLNTTINNPEEWKQLVEFLRGLQRVAKTWRTTIYILVSEGIFEHSKLMEVADCCDAIIDFKWEESTGRKRQRIMYFVKFSGAMPHLEENDLVKFASKITTEAGFEVSNIRVVI